MSAEEFKKQVRELRALERKVRYLGLQHIYDMTWSEKEALRNKLIEEVRRTIHPKNVLGFRIANVLGCVRDGVYLVDTWEGANRWAWIIHGRVFTYRSLVFNRHGISARNLREAEEAYAAAIAAEIAGMK